MWMKKQMQIHLMSFDAVSMRRNNNFYMALEPSWRSGAIFIQVHSTEEKRQKLLQQKRSMLLHVFH